jgi:hypothetical protein
MTAAAGRCDGQGLETPGVVGNRWDPPRRDFCMHISGRLSLQRGTAGREGLVIIANQAAETNHSF